jgi:hypothetical protein
MAKAEMQGGEAAHGQPHDMGFVDLKMVQHRSDVICGTDLRVFRHVFRNVGRRVTARGIGDGAVALPEMAHLRFPRAMVAGVFMDEDDRGASAGLLVIQADSVVCEGMWHRGLLRRSVRAAACLDGAGRAIRRRACPVRARSIRP